MKDKKVKRLADLASMMELFSTAHCAQLFEMHQQFRLHLRSIGKTMSVRFDFAPLWDKSPRYRSSYIRLVNQAHEET
jgi:hypothetical protein